MTPYDTAKEVAARLRAEGYIAYFAGGWVRDYVMGHPSSDIDIATDAPPEKIVQLFKRTVPVGISFGVVLVLHRGCQFEVSTFRKDLEYRDGRRPQGIVLSSPEEDALRRDFTINGMFYDPFQGQVLDYVKGQEDIEHKILRTIGDPNERFQEDRLRMIRAVRFAVRFHFTIEKNTWEAIRSNSSSLFPAVALERVWQELKKMAESPHFDQAILTLRDAGLLAILFPQLKEISKEELAARVAGFSRFPPSAPPVLYLMELFPEASLEEQIATCLYLKISNKDQNCVEWTHRVRDYAAQASQHDRADWARLYAVPFTDTALGIIAARQRDPISFLKSHEERQRALAPHIQRIRARTPLVSSSDLIAAGIAPGKHMGLLLQEAERLAINSDLHSKESVLKLLQSSPLWPDS